MCIFASALYIKLGKQLILLYFKTMQNSDSVARKKPAVKAAGQRKGVERSSLCLLHKRVTSALEAAYLSLDSESETSSSFGDAVSASKSQDSFAEAGKTLRRIKAMASITIAKMSHGVSKDQANKRNPTAAAKKQHEVRIKAVFGFMSSVYAIRFQTEKTEPEI